MKLLSKGFKENDDYIPKPFSTEILKLKVHNIIGAENGKVLS